MSFVVVVGFVFIKVTAPGVMGLFENDYLLLKQTCNFSYKNFSERV